MKISEISSRDEKMKISEISSRDEKMKIPSRDENWRWQWWIIRGWQWECETLWVWLLLSQLQFACVNLKYFQKLYMFQNSKWFQFPQQNYLMKQIKCYWYYGSHPKTTQKKNYYWPLIVSPPKMDNTKMVSILVPVDIS